MKQTKQALHNPHLKGDSFLWKGGPVGILLAHGYTATTSEVRLLGQKLHNQGYTVAGPLLPGHGTTPQEMNRCRWQDWAEALEQVYQTLVARCNHVFVGGESMGAVLALHLAVQHPEVAGVLAYAPALRIPRKTAFLTHLLKPFISQVAKKDVDSLNVNWKGYPVNPIPALYQLLRLQKEVRHQLPAIRQPLLIVQGRLDTVIDLRGVETLYHQSNAAITEFHWMENSNHVVIMEDELDQVAAITLKFLKRVLNGSAV